MASTRYSRVVRRIALTVSVFAACAALQRPWRERVDDVSNDAPACASFRELDQRAKEAGEVAAREASSADLLASQRALRSARMACARHVLETLATSREPRAELDAVAAGFAEETFDQLVKESLGAVDGSLSAMIAEAKETAREAWRRQRDAREQEVLAASSADHEQDERHDLGAIGKGALRHDEVILHEERLPAGGSRWVDGSSSRFARDHDRLAAESAGHDRQAASSSPAEASRARQIAVDDARLAAESASHDRQFARDHERLAAESAGHDRQAASSSGAGAAHPRQTEADDARLAAESASHDPQFREDTAPLESVGEKTGSTSAPVASVQSDHPRDQVWLATESAAHDRQFREDTAKLSAVSGEGSDDASWKKQETRRSASSELGGRLGSETAADTAGVRDDHLSLSETWARTQSSLERARKEHKLDAVASLLEPFRDDPKHRDEAAAAREAAARQHLALARDLGPRAHAVALHRALAARWSMAPATAPAEGAFLLERWLCASPKPVLPSLAAGIELRLRVRCQTSKPRAAPASEKGSLFENERALVKTTTDGVASVTCAGQSFQRSLHREALSLDDPALEQRRLEDDLRNLAREVRAQCGETAREQSAADCAALATLSPSDVEERFAAHAPSLAGPWPACFGAWFRERYGVEP